MFDVGFEPETVLCRPQEIKPHFLEVNLDSCAGRTAKWTCRGKTPSGYGAGGAGERSGSEMIRPSEAEITKRRGKGREETEAQQQSGTERHTENSHEMSKSRGHRRLLLLLGPPGVPSGNFSPQIFQVN